MLSLKDGSTYYTLHFLDQGWLSADLVQYLDDVLESTNRPAQILKLLGLTMVVSQKPPERRARHWVVVDLDKKMLETNSDIIRRAVDELPPESGSPVSEATLRRIHRVLDQGDFTVTFYS